MNKIYNENCLDTMAKMTDGFIDLTVTSPPYDNLRQYNGYSFDFESIAKELYRVTKDGGVVVWVVGDATANGSESGTSFRQALYFMECGFKLHDTMIYKKLNYVPLTHNRYEQEWEYMFVFSKGKPKTFNPIKTACKYAGEKTWGNPKVYKTNSSELTDIEGYVISDEKIKGNIFEYRTGSTTSSAKIKHPAPFPEQLAADHIHSWSNKGDLIYDPFMGSGTTGVVAHKLDRNYIGSEISEEYCKIAESRIQSAVGLFSNTP